jgi:hypothetical protein
MRALRRAAGLSRFASPRAAENKPAAGGGGGVTGSRKPLGGGKRLAGGPAGLTGGSMLVASEATRRPFCCFICFDQTST